MKRRVVTIVAACGLLVFLAACLLWVQYGRAGDVRSGVVQGRLEAGIASGADEIDFSAMALFTWDRMYVIGPYSSETEIERILGFKWSDYRRTTVSWNDGVCLVVFVEDGQVVHWYEQPRSIELGWLTNGEGYSPEQARFAVDRSDDRPALVPKVGGGNTTQPTLR